MKIEEAHVDSDLTIKVDDGAEPPTARRCLSAILPAIGPRQFALRAVRRRFRVGFEKRDGRWLVTSEDDSDIQRH